MDMRTGICSVSGLCRPKSLNTFARGLSKKRFLKFQYLGIIGRVVIKLDHEEVGLENVEWIRLAEDWDRWRAAVNGILNLHVP
jgi:hypothetical protein